MELLIELILVIPILYLWLVGHWFGRVLAFLAFAVAFGAGGATLALTMTPTAGVGGGLYGLAIGVGLAWLLASWPIWHLRRVFKAACEAQDAAFEAALRPVQQVPRLIDRGAAEGRFAGRQ